MALSPHDSVRRRLGPMGLRLRLGDALLFASRTLWAGAVGFALIALAGRLMPIISLRLWACAPLMIWVLIVLGYALLVPLPLRRVAQRVDILLDLRERLSTALELQQQQARDPLSQRQQEDAGLIAHTLRASQLPLRFDRTWLLWSLAPLAVGIALLALPNPQDTVIAQRQAVQSALAQTDQQLAQLAQELAKNAELSPADLERLQQQLAALRESLRRNPGDTQEALADLSAAEARLRQQLDPNADARRAALEQMARSLESISGRQPSQRPNLGQASQDLQQLAQQLAQMTPEQRQQLAQQLAQQATQQADSNQQLAQSLSNAASALRNGDTQAAAQQLQQASQNVQQAQQDLANQQATQQSLAQMQGARQQIAQAGTSQSVGSSQAPSQGQQAGTSQPVGSPQAPSQGQQGAGNQQGSSAAAQQPGGGGSTAPNLGQGQSSSSGNINPNRPAGQGQGHGSAGMVYQPFTPSGQSGTPDFVPGQQGQGGQSQSQQGQNTMPGANNPSVVPYEQIYPEYAQAASEALDRGYIPPHLKDFVRRYFSQLEP
ncbi:MAG: hypothetical protein WCJ55_11940 [Chloroflexales bacterium]